MEEIDASHEGDEDEEVEDEEGASRAVQSTHEVQDDGKEEDI